MRVDTQTILTIDDDVITRNARIAVRHSVDSIFKAAAGAKVAAKYNSWQLTMKDVQAQDQGLYMCQLNTDPMMSQMAYLRVNGESVTDITNDAPIKETSSHQLIKLDKY